MARLSKLSSLQNIYGDVSVCELTPGNRATGFHAVGDQGVQYDYNMIWSIEGNAHLAFVDTSKKTKDGFYKVEKLHGPFNAIAQASTSRLFCWTGNHVKMFDIRYGNRGEFIAEFDFEYSYIAAWYLYKEVGGLQQKQFPKIQQKIIDNQHTFVNWIFTYDSDWVRDWKI